MNRRALITGVSGYLGGRLSDHLVSEGWTVFGLARPSSDCSNLHPEVEVERFGDGTPSLPEIIERAAPEVVFHLASLYLASHRPDQIQPLVESNLLFPATLAEAMVTCGVRNLINTGTATQHFGTEAYRPLSLYAASKQACMEMLHYFHDAHGLSVTTLKLFDTYGPHDPRRKLVHLLIDSALSGDPLDLSPGEQILDLTHVDDIVSAFRIAAERQLASGEPLFDDFLVSGERVSIRELIFTVSEAIGRPVPARLGALPYRAREVMVPVCASGDRRLPGWTAKRRLAEALPGLVPDGASC